MNLRFCIPVLLCMATAANTQPVLTIIPLRLAYAPVIAVNSALNKIYLAAGNPNAQQMIEMDGATFSTSGVGTGASVAVDTYNNSYWSAGVNSGTATVWSSNDGIVATVSVGYCPVAVSVDGPDRVGWIGAQCGASNDPIWAFSTETYTIQAGPIRTGGIFGDIMANPGTGRAYLVSSGVSKRIKLPSSALTTNSFGQVLGVNATANRLYATGPGGVLQIVNGAPDPETILTNVALPFALNGNRIGVNPTLNRIYVQHTNTVVILDASTGTMLGTVAIDGMTGVAGIAVDATRNRVYAGCYAESSCVIQDSAMTANTILKFGVASNAANLAWTAFPAQRYQIQYRTNLLQSNWISLGSPITATNNHAVASESRTNAQRFYRVALVQADSAKRSAQ